MSNNRLSSDGWRGVDIGTKIAAQEIQNMSKIIDKYLNMAGLEETLDTVARGRDRSGLRNAVSGGNS